MDTTGLHNDCKEDAPNCWGHEVCNLQSSTADSNILYTVFVDVIELFCSALSTF